MTQQQTILKHLKEHAFITPNSALQVYSIYRLSDVILKLRRKGHDIKTENMTGKNQFGVKVNYGRYSLVKEPSFKLEA